MAEAPLDTPVIHPNIAEIYRRKVAGLADALTQLTERWEASAVLCHMVQEMAFSPGPKACRV